MHITIIGAGWLGLPLAERLRQRGHRVLATTTTATKLATLRSCGAEPRLLDLDAPEPFPKIVTDLLVITPPPGRGAQHVVERHRNRHERLLRELVADGTPRVVYLSSTGVYPNTNTRTDETTPPDPVRPSGAAMLAGEAVWRSSGLPWTIFRLAGLVGGTRQPGRWFAGKTNVPGGSARVNMVHRTDCLRALERTVADPTLVGIFNLCADEHPERREFYRKQAEKHGFVPPEFATGSAAEQAYKLVDNRKFKRIARFAYAHPDPNQF